MQQHIEILCFSKRRVLLAPQLHEFLCAIQWHSGLFSPMRRLALKEKQGHVQKEGLKGRVNMEWFLNRGWRPLAFILSIPHGTTGSQSEHTSYGYLTRKGLWHGVLRSSKKSNSKLYQNPNVKTALYKLPAGCLVSTFMPCLCWTCCLVSPWGQRQSDISPLGCSVCSCVSFRPQKLDEEKRESIYRLVVWTQSNLYSLFH